MTEAEAGNRTRATLVTGECSRHCAIPAPQEDQHGFYVTFIPVESTEMSISCKSEHLFLVWHVSKSQNIYACADGVFEQERKTQYPWTWRRSVVPDESSRSMGRCDCFRRHAVGRLLLSDIDLLPGTAERERNMGP